MKSKMNFFPNNLSAGTQLDPQFVLVKPMNWSDAQRYCRENYIDLATVRNDAENQEVLNLVPSGQYAWIGLYREAHNSIFYNWSDGSVYSFTKWDGSVSASLNKVNMMCGVQESKEWALKSCEERFPFVCYSIPGECFTVLQWKSKNPA